MTDSKLFQPINIGDLTLNHRIVLAPLTRMKSTEKGHVPYTSVMKEYYSQRYAAVTFFKAYLIRNQITDAVHAKGSFIFAQLWAQGRAANISDLKDEDLSLELVAPSAIKLSYTAETPSPLTLDEIHEYPKLFAQAAANAVFKAGFDGVEIHGVNGFLVDQFIQDMSNKRTDDYGGSIENRARFPMEVIDAVVDAVGAHRTAFRVSPWNTWQEMRMEDPIPTFSYLVKEIGQRHTDLAYLHVIEPRVNGTEAREDEPGTGEMSG